MGRRTFQQMLAADEDAGEYLRLASDDELLAELRRRHRAERERYESASPEERRLLDFTRTWETEAEREARQRAYRGGLGSARGSKGACRWGKIARGPRKGQCRARPKRKG